MRRAFAAVVSVLVALVLAAAVVHGPLHRQPPIHEPDGTWFEPAAGDERAVVWAVGNGADGGPSAKRLARLIAEDDPDAVLYLGDVYARSTFRRLLTGEGTEHDFEHSFDSVYGTLADRTAPTAGNHEWRRRGDGYEPYWRRVHGSTPPAWYAFELAGWQFLSLNSEAPHGDDSAQVRWLEERVRAGGSCRIAFWHEARFSVATAGGNQPDLAPLWDVLADHATVVINAHDHALQRLEPVDGITPFVIGAGGHGHHAIDHEAPNLAFGDDETYGALRLELRPHSLRFQVLSIDGDELDDGQLGCRPASRRQ